MMTITMMMTNDDDCDDDDDDDDDGDDDDDDGANNYQCIQNYFIWQLIDAFFCHYIKTHAIMSSIFTKYMSNTNYQSLCA